MQGDGQNSKAVQKAGGEKDDDRKGQDNGSPATRLLAKRRMMYQKQDEYEQKKKESKQNELEFKEQEKDLRNQDMKIQESMIRFSVFLQENEIKQKKASDKQEQERALLKLRTDEIERKEKQAKLLFEKYNRIKLKKAAISKYEEYLLKVKDSTDEFPEVQDILTRHKTLIAENKKLEQRNQELDDQSEELRKKIEKYEKKQRQESLHLNNYISTLKQEIEIINDQQKDLKVQALEVTKNKLGKVSELAQILMAVGNIEQKCFSRKTESTKRLLYPVSGAENKPKNFDNFKLSCKFAELQLNSIKNYLKDYKEICDQLVHGNKEVANYVTKLQEKNEL